MMGWDGLWLAGILNYFSFSSIQNPEQSADEDAEKNEEDSEGEKGSRLLLQVVRRSKVRGSFVMGLVALSLKLGHSKFFLPLFLLGSSDEDEDEDGVSAAAFLKKKSEAPSGESRKFLKKMDVRARVRLMSELPARGHLGPWEEEKTHGLGGLEFSLV